MEDAHMRPVGYSGVGLSGAFMSNYTALSHIEGKGDPAHTFGLFPARHKLLGYPHPSQDYALGFPAMGTYGLLIPNYAGTVICWQGKTYTHGTVCLEEDPLHEHVPEEARPWGVVLFQKTNLLKGAEKSSYTSIEQVGLGLRDWSGEQ